MMSKKLANLRQHAETILNANSVGKMPHSDQLAKVLHELDTYQIELELQNEELLQTEKELRTEAAIHFRHYEMAPVAYVTLNTKNNILELNKTFLSMLGLTRKEDILNKKFTNYIKDEDQDIFYLFIQTLIQSQSRQSCELQLKLNNHALLWVKLDALTEQDIQIAISDISKLKQNEAEQRLAISVFENSPSGIIVLDKELTIVSVNSAFEVITGYSKQNSVGKKTNFLRSDRHNAQFYQEMWEKLDRDKSWHGEIWNRRKSGQVYPEWLSIATIQNVGQKEARYVCIFSDITAKKQAEENIHHMAFFDTLTELPNRSLLYDRLRQSLSQAERNLSSGALMMLDLDHFKIINDSLGHQIGDQLLQAVAQRLQDIIREEDTLSRLGGDEFVVLLTDLKKNKNKAIQQATIVAKKILEELDKTFNINGHELQISASIGIVIYPNDAREISDIIKLADDAMYKAKRHDRNNFQFFTVNMQNEASRRMAIQSELREGLKRKEFELFFQPQISIATGRIQSVEALLRWHHPVKGLLAPAEFMPFTETFEAMHPLLDWVLKEACRQIHIWSTAEIKNEIKFVAVNVSVRQFIKSNFIAEVKALIKNANIKPNQLQIEVTEKILIGNIKKTAEALKSMGVRIALSHFGTDYSSFSSLKHIPVDALKIDQSFIHNISSKLTDSSIVKAIISLAHDLNISVIAEGVETEQQLEFLKENSCDAYQGYYYGKAVPAEKLLQLLEIHPQQ
ncbi:MAG: diguanylate cyclase (GGDEF)-like protein/PAS domain S-box-containing protein [Oleiphilaceae bacterium]|jgi:diguanylate cyclase (GGDEF)-like protein/PAS domain S-box-containing protein